MARIHGRRGRLYVSATNGAAASPLANLNSFSLDFSVDNQDTTAFGDANKQYVAGLPDASGSFAGFYSSDDASLFTAATDGLSRKFYLYPSTSESTTYWSGEALFDASLSQSVGGPVTISGNFQASSAVTRTSA